MAGAAGVATGVWSPGRRVLTAGLVATITLVAVESLSVATVLPLVGRDLGDLRLYGWVFSAFFLASLVGIATAGRLADRVALVGPFLSGLACFAVGLVVGGAAPSMAVLVAGRALQGLGAGAVPAAAYVAIGRAYPAASRPRMFAVLSTAWVVPGIVGPSLAAVVAAAAGWRWVFLGLVPLVALAALVSGPALRAVPSPPPGSDAPTSATTTPALATALGAAVVLAGLSTDRLVVAVPLAVAGAAVGGRALRRLVPPGTFRAARGLPAAVATRGLLTFGYFGVDAYVPLTLTTDRHAPTAVGGAALTAATMTWTAGAWGQARLLGRFGARRLVAVGVATVVAGIGLFSLMLVGGAPVWLGVVAWAVAGLGIGTAYAPLSVTTLEQAPPGEQGRASAALQLTDTLGTALGAGAGGAAVAVAHRQGWPLGDGLGLGFAVAAAVALLGVAAAGGLPGAADRGDDSGPACG
ncbi:MAG TPA: MFS transporter [Acidimicrobiales bacterium]|nr:MFS transporter [Acidimicrobiales bacterium]